MLTWILSKTKICPGVVLIDHDKDEYNTRFRGWTESGDMYVRCKGINFLLKPKGTAVRADGKGHYITSWRWMHP